MTCACISATGLTVTFSDQPRVFADIDLHLASTLILSGQRWLLDGANGSGKSVLLRVLAGERPPLSGAFSVRGRCVLPDQHLLLLDWQCSALENYKRCNPGWPDAEYRNRLAPLKLRGERTLAPVATLSGGERLKVALAAMMMGPVAFDLLLLDEPDNHLDLESQALLLQTLNWYQGTLIMVNHSSRSGADIQSSHSLVLER